MNKKHDVTVLGAGLAGCSTALKLAQLGYRVLLIDKSSYPVSGASRHNEGKLHLGYIYAADPKHKTYRKILEGSLQFLDLTQQLTGVSPTQIPRSQPFFYAIPADSQLSVEQIYKHFARVDEYVASHGDHTSHIQLETVLPADGTMVAGIFSDEIQAVIQTSEIALDPSYVASIYGAAVLAEPLIDFLGGHEVTMVEDSGGAYNINAQSAEGTIRIEAQAVANCLWENRLHIDALVGFTSSKPWLWRWKATLSFETPSTLSAPSTTLLLGPYGDYVPYSSGRSYLSWYPSCLVGSTSQLDANPLQDAIETYDDQRIRRESFEGLGRYIPALIHDPQLYRRATVSGGYIMALGTTDIEDPDSGLHQRHEIGPSIDGTWLSLETGKFCTAPMFGVQAANMLHERLR
ncbi:MAG: FAD-dependent oxidoreductase [Halioglobus sp.]